MTDTMTARRAAFAKLARESEAALMALARRLCRGNLDRSEDLVQEALVRGYQAYVDGKFEDGSNERPWLARILTNIFINDYRRRQKWEADVDYETLTSSGEAGPADTRAAVDDVPGVRMLSRILDEELEKALAMLSEGLRLCIILVDIEGLDYVQAAAALNIPVGTVRSRLSRARMQLHDILMDYAKQRRLLA